MAHQTLNRRVLLAPTLFAIAVITAVASRPRPAAAQGPTCSSCNVAVPCDQKIAQIFMNEDGHAPTSTVRVCGPGSADLPAKHATLLTFPGATHIDYVCVGARSTSPFAQTCELFYATIDPLTGKPDFEQGTTQFSLPAGGSMHQIIPVNWTLTGTRWVGVRFPAGACSLSEMGVRPRTSGAAAVWISGDAWRDYTSVGYGDTVPVIRPITSYNAVSAPQIIVNSIYPLPFTTDENGASFDVAISLSSEPCDDVYVFINPSDVSEAIAMPGQLTFNAQTWNTPQIVTIMGLDDPQADGDINYTVDISSATPTLLSACYGGLSASLSAINLDNDVPVAASCPPPDLAWDLHPPMAPPPLMHQAMAYDSNRDRVVMFGGESPGGFSNETYEWDSTVWTLVHSGGPGAPSPRVDAKMAFDSARGVCVLVGGVDAFGPSDETWEWDGVSWQQRAVGAGPGGPRSLHAIAYDASRGKTVVFGGLPPYLETWEWDGMSWTPVFTPTVVGTGDRNLAAMAYDPVHQRVLLFGGYDMLGYNNDVWAYDGADWTILGTIGVAPTPRVNATFVFDAARNVLVLHGGDDVTGVVTDDTWELDAGTLTWTQTSALPPPRTSHAAAYDAAHCTTVLYGGDTGGMIAPPETLTYPRNLVGGMARSFCVVGTSTGVDWSWALNGPTGGPWSLEQPNEPGLPAGSSADAIVAQWVNSINNSGCCTIEARVSAQSPQCFEVFTSDPLGFDLCVGPAGTPPTCCVAIGQSCSFNPTVSEFYYAGTDCDGNGIDDGVDIAIDASLDSNGDGILDSCQTYILGDMNCDQQVDGRDIQGFVLAYTSPADYAAIYPTCNINAADYNNDGVMNLNDLAAFLNDLLP